VPGAADAVATFKARNSFLQPVAPGTVLLTGGIL
jgi:hypothetical protein